VEVREASEVEHWTDVLNASLGTHFIFSASFLRVAHATDRRGLRRIGFLLKNAYNEYFSKAEKSDFRVIAWLALECEGCEQGFSEFDTPFV